MSKRLKSNPNNSLFAPLAVGFFIGAVSVGTVVLVWNHDREARSYPVYQSSETVAAPAAPPAAAPMARSAPGLMASSAVDPAVARVAARFDCACGECKDKLDVCKCATAQQERTFIQDQLRHGKSETEVADALKQKYGGLLPGAFAQPQAGAS